MAQRLWMGSMTLVLLLQASAKRVVAEKTSMVRRSACCAPFVMLSACDGERGGKGMGAREARA